MNMKFKFKKRLRKSRKSKRDLVSETEHRIKRLMTFTLRKRMNA